MTRSAMLAALSRGAERPRAGPRPDASDAGPGRGPGYSPLHCKASHCDRPARRCHTWCRATARSLERSSSSARDAVDRGHGARATSSSSAEISSCIPAPKSPDARQPIGGGVYESALAHIGGGTVVFAISHTTSRRLPTASRPELSRTGRALAIDLDCRDSLASPANLRPNRRPLACRSPAIVPSAHDGRVRTARHISLAARAGSIAMAIDVGFHARQERYRLRRPTAPYTNEAWIRPISQQSGDLCAGRRHAKLLSRHAR